MKLRIKLLAAAAVAVMIWLAAASDRWSQAFAFTGQQQDYYNLLVDGLLEGHLYMKAEVHPGRLSPDIEVRKLSPYLLDAAQYGNHYYLYYGVVPAITVLAPYSWLTGHDLSLNVATLGFVLAGFFFSLAWYDGLRRTCFPATPAVIDVTVVLLLAFGPATMFLVRRAMFYELPLAAGYACLAGFLWAATKALREPARAGRWIAVASLSVGLAAGCHPNHALLTPLLALVAWWSYRTLPPPSSRWRAGGRLAAAAVLPAALIGAGLAAYNFARFGDPLEFGFKYGVNVFFETQDRLYSTSFLWPNLKWYYLTPPTLLPYFPFVFPAAATFRPPGYHGAEAIHGQFLVFLLLAWIGAGLVLNFRRLAWPALLRRLILILTVAFVVAALFIHLLGIRANRYMVDFQLPLIALAVLLAANLGQRRQRSRGLALWRAGLLALTLVMSVSNILAAVQQFDQFRYTRPAAFAFLTRTLNPSWAFWDRLGLVKTGTLVFDVSFPAQPRPVWEPLLTLGAPGYSDSVYAIQHPGGLLEFAIDHFGHGGPKSRIFPYQPGQTYTVQIELGGFYPPASDPYFAQTPDWIRPFLKTIARVDFDGQSAIDENIPLYDAAPWQREFGSNLTTHTAFSSHFSGRISRIRWRDPVSLADLIAFNAHSCVQRLIVELPAPVPASGQPLASWGVAGHGSMLYLQPRADGQWKLALDEWGYGYGLDFPLDLPPGEHVFDLFIGPLAATDPRIAQAERTVALPAGPDELLVWLDGTYVGRFPLYHHLDAFKEIVIGSNPQGFSTSEPLFYGKIRPRPLTITQVEKILHAIPPHE